MSYRTHAFRKIEMSPTNHVVALIRPDDTGRKFELFEYIMEPAGQGPPVHFHMTVDETFLVVEGAAVFERNGEKIERATGGVVHVPRGTPHAFRNARNVQLRMLVTMSPAIDFLEYFAELQKLIQKDGWPLPQEKLAPLWSRFDSYPA